MQPRCPLDHAPTQLAANEGHVAWRCTRCEGFWLPGIEVDAVARERHLDVAQFRAKLAEGRLGDSPLACPGGHPMVRSEYRTLELDWCPTCAGIWFDAGELRRLLDLHPDFFNRDHVRTLLLVVGVFLVREATDD